MKQQEQTDKIGLFDYLNSFTTHSPIDVNNDESMKQYPPYMINRFVSMVEIFIPFVNAINKFSDISKKIHYNFYANVIPKRKQYFNYIKKKKNIDDDKVKLLAEYFETGIREINEYYINILNDKQIQEIVDKYSYGKK